MLWIFWITIALGGGIVVDAEVPVEVRIEEQPYVKMYYPGQARFEWTPGTVDVTVLINGKANVLTLLVPEIGHVQIIAGRNGLSHDKTVTPLPVAESTGVIFRTSGPDSIQIRLNKARHQVSPGLDLAHSLPSGKHNIEIRNSAGTIIWARGQLDLSGREDVVVQLSAGKMPEVVGLDSHFIAAGW